MADSVKRSYFACPWCETAFQDDGEDGFDESEVVEIECHECNQVFFVRKTVVAYYRAVKYRADL